MIQQLDRLLASRPVVLQALRFVAIGALNTAVDFLILNLLTRAFGIEAGWQLGLINVVGVTVAILQSYFWNKHWTFAASSLRPVLQLVWVVVVGFLGTTAFVLAVLPSVWRFAATETAFMAGASYFALVLGGFLLGQLVCAANMHFQALGSSGAARAFEFGKFVVISVIGVFINSLVLTLGSTGLLSLGVVSDIGLANNTAKLAAVFVVLVWNFLGYKFVVFRK